jgi:hypothetical protein
MFLDEKSPEFCRSISKYQRNTEFDKFSNYFDETKSNH